MAVAELCDLSVKLDILKTQSDFKKDEAELSEIEAEMKEVVGDQRLTCVQSRLVARREILLQIIAFGSSIAGREQIVDVPLPFVQEEFVESEALESFSQRTVSIMKDIGSIAGGPERRRGYCHQNTFLQVVRNPADGVQSRHRRFGGRPRAVSTPSVWKPVCGVGSPVHQLLDEMEVMILNSQERINESIVEVTVPDFREETVEVVEEPVFEFFSQDGVDQILAVPCCR